MCTNYRPAEPEALLSRIPGAIRDTQVKFKPEVFPNDAAPIIRLEHGDDVNRQIEQFRIGHSTLQVETATGTETCALAPDHVV